MGQANWIREVHALSSDRMGWEWQTADDGVVFIGQVAPGPRLTNATPVRPVYLASETAMNPPPPSCRTLTRSISGAS